MIYKRLALSTLALVIFLSPIAYAEDEPSAILTSGQLSLIRANCLSVQATMMRLHANDALARVHLGQEYETISTKLMTPMNSRVVLDKYDGSSMIKTAAAFNLKLDEFRSLYQQYDRSMVKAMQMKCTEQPATLLDVLTQARDYRAQVRDSVISMSDLVNQYRVQVGELKTQIESTKSQEAN